jgi:hypothetical protein
MLIPAVDSYLAARRAVGFQLRDAEAILRDFGAFASAKGDTHVRTRTVLEWIRSRNASPLRHCVRLRTVVRFARYLHAEDKRHEVPPEHAFGHHWPLIERSPTRERPGSPDPAGPGPDTRHPCKTAGP